MKAGTIETRVETKSNGKEVWKIRVFDRNGRIVKRHEREEFEDLDELEAYIMLAV